jgi:hypothetical protein
MGALKKLLRGKFNRVMLGECIYISGTVELSALALRPSVL